MTWPIKPLVYVLGFSVLAACKTTNTVAIDELHASEERRTLELTLTDGSRVTIRDAVVTADEITGLITEEDTVRLDASLRNWKTSPYRLVSPTKRWSGYKVVINRSEVGLVMVETADTLATAVSVLAVLVVSCLVFAYEMCSSPDAFC